MKRSKLEIYAHERFGPPDELDAVTPEDSGSAPRPRHEPVRRRRARRGGIGVWGAIKLVLMLGPMAILLGATMLTECGGAAQGSWMPEFLRSTACARRDLTGRVFSLEGQLRTVAAGLR